MQVAHIHGGNIRDAAEKFGIDKKSIIDFSANINPLGPSPMVYKAISENLEQMIHYPDSEAKELKDSLADFLGIAPQEIILGNGAVELIYLLVKQLKPKKVLVPAPTFCEYELAVITNGGEVVDLPLKKELNFNVDLEQTLEMLADIDLIILCNPNNPTGQLIGKEDLLAILAEAKRHGVFLLLDEAFMDFVEKPENYSLVSELRSWENLFVLYSLTKFFGIPGLRLGAGLANEGLIKKLEFIKDPWNVNCFAQLSGIVSLKDKAYIERTKNFVNDEKVFLFEELSKLKKLNPFRPSVNYIFIDVSKTSFSSTELRELLAKEGILVRDCSSYKELGNHYIRVAVKSRAENLRLITAIQKVLD